MAMNAAQRRRAAKQALDTANAIDPGLEKGSTFSIDPRRRDKYLAISNHSIAYGIRWCLEMLDLLPEEEE